MSKAAMKRYGAYKDSGVEWLGEVPEHWNVKRLKETITGNLSYGANESAVDSNLSHPRYIRITDFSDDGMLKEETYKSLTPDIAKDYLLKEDDILLARSGATAGKAFHFKNYSGKACYAGYLIKARPNKSILLSDFLSYFTKSFVYNDWRNFIVIKATIENISAEKYGLFLFVPTPPTQEQTAIAAYLDTKTAQIDRKVDLLTQKATQYGKLKQSLINETVARGLDKTVAMKDSGVEWIGEMPEHWEVKRIKDLSMLQSGDSIVSEQIEEKGKYPVYGGNGLRGYYSKYTNNGEYILIGRQGALCGNINYASGKFWASEHAVVAYLKCSIDMKWYGEMLRIMNLNQYSLAAAQPGLAMDGIKRLLLPVPPLQEQKTIADYLGTKTAHIGRIVETINTQIEKLKELRKTLINVVVTGKIKVVEG